MADLPPKPPEKLPGNGLLGWLGRQVAYVKKAIQADVAASNQTIYRDTRTEEKPLPQDPNVKLRRTTIDEVIVKHPPADRSQ
jgi:hypothetical protein